MTPEDRKILQDSGRDTANFLKTATPEEVDRALAQELMDPHVLPAVVGSQMLAKARGWTEEETLMAIFYTVLRMRRAIRETS